METMKTTDNADGTHQFDFDASRLVGDLRDAMLDELKVSHALPWNLRPEAEQRAVIEHIHSTARSMVNDAVRLISDKGFASLPGEIAQVRVKDGYQVQVNIMRGADHRHDLIDRQGSEVVLVLADASAFRGTRGAVPITPPAPLLDYAEEAARVADAAEQGVVWWHIDHPEETFEDLGEYEAHHDCHHMVPFEVCRTGWLAPRWVVTFQFGDAEGNVDGDDAQYFDTRAEAQAFADSLKAEGDPTATEEGPAEPEGGVPVVEEAPSAEEVEACPEDPDEGIVMDDPTIRSAMEGKAVFHVEFVTDGKALWYCWRDAVGAIRCHEDVEVARDTAARQKEAYEEEQWSTAEDRAKPKSRRGKKAGDDAGEEPVA